jgi:hypothetical protein
MARYYWSQPAAIRPAVFLYVATALREEPDTLGIMFDVASRRGAAVFYESIARSAARSNVAVAAEYIRTTVHELGHTFNLPHAFEDLDLFRRRSDSLTFMNYPQSYTGGAGPSSLGNAARYWRDFQYQFDQVELLALCHGPYHRVIMGGDRYIGPTVGGSRDFTVEAGRGSGGLELKLRLKPDRGPHGRLEFGEPVHVELKLVNRSGEERAVLAALEPKYEFTRFLIRRPDGRLVEFRLPYSLSVDPRGVGEVLTPERDCLFGDVCLSFGRDGFYFLQPGPHLIQAVHLTATGLLASNILKVWVRHPTRAQEDLVVPTLTDAVARYFLVEGSPHRPEAEAVLDELAAAAGLASGNRAPRRRPPALASFARPLVTAYKRCRILAAARGAIAYDPKAGTLTRIDPTLDLESLREAAGFDPGLTRLVARPSVSNIAFGQLADLLVRKLADDGRHDERHTVARVALDYLNRQTTTGRNPRATPLPAWVDADYRGRWLIA